MKKLESSLTNMALVLTGVAVIMGGILAFVNHLTEGPINEQKTKALADGIKTVMVCNDLVVAKTDTVKQNDAKGKELTYIIYQIQDAQKKDLGAAVQSTTGGFGGDLKVLVGFDPEGPCWSMLRHQDLAPKPTNGSRKVRRATSSVRILRNPSLFRKTVDRWMPSRLLPSRAVLSSWLLTMHTQLTRQHRLMLPLELQNKIRRIKL